MNTLARPCLCDKIRLGQPWSAGRDCRLCWNYHHRSDYNRLWGGNGIVTAIAGRPEPTTINIPDVVVTVVAPSPTGAQPPVATTDNRGGNCIHLGGVLQRNDRACTRCWTYECDKMGRTIPAAGIRSDTPTCTGCPHYESV